MLCSLWPRSPEARCGPNPEEVRAVCLLPLEEAQRRLTYAADKELLEKAKNMILDEKNG